MNILILGINYAPEMIGIGPYTAGMAQFLARRGHAVTVICAKPYYPQWSVDPNFVGGGTRISDEEGVRVVRVPTYVPSQPTGVRRVAHHMTFAARAHAMMVAETRRSKPSVIIGIAPSLISMMAARDAARRTGAKLWLHLQDFEVEAAFATGLLRSRGPFAEAALRFEEWALKADRVSTISPQMCAKLLDKKVPANRIFEFRNWANIEEVVPLEHLSSYREAWGLKQRHVAIYSGNIANKQGIEIVVEAARLLSKRDDLQFIVCGDGPNRTHLEASSADLRNIQFKDLQPRAKLSDLLGLASVHLLPQIAGAADLVLPSKLTNMLASGRPIAATADADTGLAAEVDGCGLIGPPGNAKEFAANIVKIIDDDALRARLGVEARRRAVSRWSRDEILSRFETELIKLTAEVRHIEAAAAEGHRQTSPFD